VVAARYSSLAAGPPRLALGPGPLQAGSQMRTPRAAAMAGVIFSVFLMVAVMIALNLIPFAGISER
jgi:hypothetical protein